MTTAIQAAADLAHRPADSILTLTTEAVPGHRIVAVIGLVRGNTIRARHLGHDIMAALKGIVGGEISEYTKLMAESREQALDRLRAEAAARGANAVLGVRFTTSMVMQGSAELLAYGTAVRIERDDP
ncbi:MAG: hypothetical protein ACI8PZ_003446 [Myxococcota bacterium]|jgi:uncharacterized protein YbjQ (UPF0145 family)